MTKRPSDKLTENSHLENAPGAVRETIRESGTVSEELAGKRFDAIAAQLFPEFSRGRLQQWIESGQLTVNGEARQKKHKLAAGAILQIEAEYKAESAWIAESLPLDIIFEDQHLLVLNKAVNCVVHPAAGQHSGTLANAILAHCPGNAELPRCGIIHRLDKDTTGLLVVAKSLIAHASLVEQLQDRSVKRIYRAIACGKLIAGGTIDAPIGRHPTQRTRMAVIQNRRTSDGDEPSPGSKTAITHYRIARRYEHFTELTIQLETGRTHQIRVHMAHIRHPLLGDATYNPRYKRPQGISDELNDSLKTFRRQALHATELSFLHPASGETCEFHAEPPADYLALLDKLGEIAITH